MVGCARTECGRLDKKVINTSILNSDDINTLDWEPTDITSADVVADAQTIATNYPLLLLCDDTKLQERMTRIKKAASALTDLNESQKTARLKIIHTGSETDTAAKTAASNIIDPWVAWHNARREAKTRATFRIRSRAEDVGKTLTQYQCNKDHSLIGRAPEMAGVGNTAKTVPQDEWPSNKKEGRGTYYDYIFIQAMPTCPYCLIQIEGKRIQAYSPTHNPTLRLLSLESSDEGMAASAGGRRRQRRTVRRQRASALPRHSRRGPPLGST